MNKVTPKSLLNSKWTKVKVEKKEKHFIITQVEFNEDQTIASCIIEAVISKNEYEINWRDLKNAESWKQGWK